MESDYYLGVENDYYLSLELSPKISLQLKCVNCPGTVSKSVWTSTLNFELLNLQCNNMNPFEPGLTPSESDMGRSAESEKVKASGGCDPPNLDRRHLRRRFGGWC